MKTLVQKNSDRLLQPLRFIQQRIEDLEIQEEQTARRIIKLIPAQCPFAREVRLFDRIIFRIPPLCKINPLYEQLMMLRFRAMSFLADQCGEDITTYCT